MAASSDTFMVELDDVNDEEFELRIKAYGKKQHRNFTGYDQQRPAVVYGHRHATVHGSFVDREDERQDGSLIILDWHFLPRDPGKRFKFVRINVVFNGPQGCSPRDEPAIYQMAPRGSFALLKTTYTEERKKGLEASFGAQFGGSADLKGAYELSKSTTMADKIRISGKPYLDYSTGPERDPDRLNAIEWTFYENESQRSGLPTYVRTAILLSRETDDEFTATFTIRAKVGKLTDMETKLRKVLGRKDEDDPIVFVPSMKEKTAFDDKANDLHKINLQDQCIFVVDHDVPGAEEEKTADDQGSAVANEIGVGVQVTVTDEASV
ncbi:hypothetical protein FALBO_5226 [Fusarium albosuccineum]|uniref:Uncharacterized protein n=1 Tax=Fusarium albosuccineum TaxID=1237068 RepID=A0A8H4PFP0_9HYPO|nr:hypothetical protein FALBO_5226 [Fusarium albosuccineum]